jgi:hypothetical protein
MIFAELFSLLPDLPVAHFVVAPLRFVTIRALSHIKFQLG